MQLRLNAEPARRAHDPPRSDFGGEPRRHGVDRLGQRIAQADVALIDPGIVSRRPARHGGRPVIGDGVGRIAAFERREIDERLERRARLAKRLERAVERTAE